MNRKEIKEKLIDWKTKFKPEELPYERMKPQDPKYITEEYWDTSEGTRYISYCPRCNVFKKEACRYVACPTCNLTSYFCENDRVYAEKEEDITFFYIFNPSFRVKCPDMRDYDDPEAWLKSHKFVGIYDKFNYRRRGLSGCVVKDKGVFFLTQNEKLSVRGYNFKEDLYRLKNAIPMEGTVPVPIQTDFPERDAEKRKKKPGKLEKYINMTLDFPSDDMFLPDLDVGLHTRISKIGNNSSGIAYCGACHKTYTYGSYHVEGISHSNVEEQCPKCGLIAASIPYLRQNSSSFNKKVVLFELLDDKALLIRFFSTTYRLSEVGKIEICRQEEIWRAFFTEKKAYLFEGQTKKDTWGKITAAQIYITRAHYVQKPEEIISIIRASQVKYSELEYALGLTKKDADIYMDMTNNFYLFRWYKMPVLGGMIKLGLKTMVRDLCMCPTSYKGRIGFKETSVCKALRINKPILKMIREIDASYTEMKEIEYLWEMDQKVTLETYQQIKHDNLSIARLKEMHDTYHISLSQILDYLESCYNHQCIERPEALTHWNDYLRMATVLKYPLNDKSRKYPDSLKKEHDKASFAYRAMEDELIQSEFEEASRHLQKYEYSYGDYQIIAPRTPKDIMKEKHKLNHCVDSYIAAIRKRKTNVVFLREKEHPDVPLYTVEVNNDHEIIQVKGYCNCPPSGKSVFEFIDKWAERKHLRPVHLG